jgi:hypothetical protein
LSAGSELMLSSWGAVHPRLKKQSCVSDISERLMLLN